MAVRWLKDTEVFNYLRDIEQLLQMGFDVKTTPHEKPPISGDLFIFTKEKHRTGSRTHIWRKDLMNYGKSECYQKLQIDSRDVGVRAVAY